MIPYSDPIETGTDHLRAGIKGEVGVVVLHRPHRRNALSDEMLHALARVVERFEADPGVAVVLITGAGGAFCAGGDVKEFAARGGEGGGSTVVDPERVRQQRLLQRATTGRLYRMPKPTLAVVPGAVAGAGLGLALACDLRIGSLDTVISTAFGGVGLSGDYGTAWLLTRLVGPSRARRLMFLGERFDAGAAHGIGLLDWLVPVDDLPAAALATAGSLARGPRMALGAMKHNLVDAAVIDLEQAMDLEVQRHLECGVSTDHQEGIAAFVEKRPPSFGG